MKCLILRRRTLTVLACALLAAAMFALVNAPAVAEASATDRYFIEVYPFVMGSKDSIF